MQKDQMVEMQKSIKTATIADTIKRLTESAQMGEIGKEEEEFKPLLYND